MDQPDKLASPKVAVELQNMTSARVFNSVNQSQRAIHKLLGTCLEPAGLTVTQWMLLSLLSDGPRTSTALARSLGSTTAYISLTLRQLRQIKPDYIMESGDQSDVRVKILALSPDGARFTADVEGRLQSCLHHDLVQKIAPADLETYFSVAGFIATNVAHGTAAADTVIDIIR